MSQSPENDFAGSLFAWRGRRRDSSLVWCFVKGGLTIWLSMAAQLASGSNSLTDLSLEELLNVEVTSVSKKAERYFDAPAAVYVITQEDMRRSGATSIAEALRMVPGVEVARIDASKWAITARGFNNQFANKLLILLDGRTLYSPLFGGVFWDVQDTVLEDIERIEVIRGPGGTLWGANAVNGVINIITKSAADTQGGLANAAGGKGLRGVGETRYGTRLGDDLSVRLFAKYVNWDSFTTSNRLDAADDWQIGRGGFRLDWRASEKDQIMVQGALYQGTTGELLTRPSLLPPYASTTTPREHAAGGHLLARWRHSFRDGSTAQVHAYYDRTHRDIFSAREDRDTLDLDLQHRFRWRQRHEVVWGLGYRLSNDKTRSGDGVALHPHDRLLNLGSFFVQDDFTLLPDTLRLIAGTKIEHNDFTGFEIQPSGRVLWLPTRSQTVWAAISRAVRMPTRADSDVRFDVNVIPPATSSDLPVRVTVLGNEDFESENLLSYEIGYRLEPFAAALVDLATFYNEYHDLRTQRSGDPAFQAQPSPHIEQPLIFENGMHGHAYGFELAASYRPASWCKVSAGYTWFDLRLRLDPSSQDVGSLVHARNDPQNQVNARLYLDLPWNFELDTMLYYVDRFLAGFGAGAVPVSSYIRPDMRLSWRPHEQLALSVTVQDLAANSRVEQVPGLGGSPPVEIPRIAFGQVRWVF